MPLMAGKPTKLYVNSPPSIGIYVILPLARNGSVKIIESVGAKSVMLCSDAIRDVWVSDEINGR